MKKQAPELPVRKLVLEKKTIMKLNDHMMKRIEAGFNTKTSQTPPCEVTTQTESCRSCMTEIC